jgi:glycosyltransferase involved in cell wall biosynthesis
MNVLHIVGLQNGWALCNRANALIAALQPEHSGTLASYRELPADFKGFDLVHVHGLQIIPLIRRLFDADGATPWGFEVVSHRAMKHATDPELVDNCRPWLGRASFVVCKNPRLVPLIAKFVSVEPTFIPNGVDVALFRPRPVRLGCVWSKNKDSKTEYKGIPLILKAIAALNEKYEGLVTFEWTPGPDDILPQAELVPYYQSLDALVCASVAEGCSNVVNEALACGVRVISTDVGIVPELAGECDIIKVARTPEGIAAGIEQAFYPLVRRLDLMESMSWSSPSIKGEYLKLYEAVVGVKA